MFKKGYEKEIKQLVKVFVKEKRMTRDEAKKLHTYTLKIFEHHIKTKGSFTYIEYDTIETIMCNVCRSIKDGNLISESEENYSKMYEDMELHKTPKHECKRLSLC